MFFFLAVGLVGMTKYFFDSDESNLRQTQMSISLRSDEESIRPRGKQLSRGRVVSMDFGNPLGLGTHAFAVSLYILCATTFQSIRFHNWFRWSARRFW